MNAPFLFCFFYFRCWDQFLWVLVSIPIPASPPKTHMHTMGTFLHIPASPTQTGQWAHSSSLSAFVLVIHMTPAHLHTSVPVSTEWDPSHTAPPPSLLLGASHTLRTLSALFRSYHRAWFWPFSLWPLGLGYLPPFWGLAPWHFSASLADSFSIWERERCLQDQTNTDM